MRRREFIGLIGSAPMLPLAARAQSRIYRVAFLTLEADEKASVLVGPLGELGYVEGTNLAVTHRSAEGDPARLATLAEELVRGKPDVLVAGWGTLAPRALKAATATIPIVFTTVGDPVGSGLVQSLPRPGGNLTGMSGLGVDIKSKQLQLLVTAVPGQRVVGVLLNPDTPFSALSLAELRRAADQDGIRLELLEVRKPEEFTAHRMDALVASGATSLFIIDDPLLVAIRVAVIEQTTRLRLPSISTFRDYALAGALLSYGVHTSERYRRTAWYVDKVLKGAKPSDLPVEQPTKFQLLINLKTAKAFGLALPPSVLALADEVIE
jgi:putative tryptophan/tyrosine transport system substrate-binding protein